MRAALPPRAVPRYLRGRRCPGGSGLQEGRGAPVPPAQEEASAPAPALLFTAAPLSPSQGAGEGNTIKGLNPARGLRRGCRNAQIARSERRRSPAAARDCGTAPAPRCHRLTSIHFCASPNAGSGCGQSGGGCASPSSSAGLAIGEPRGAPSRRPGSAAACAAACRGGAGRLSSTARRLRLACGNPAPGAASVLPPSRPASAPPAVLPAKNKTDGPSGFACSPGTEPVPPGAAEPSPAVAGVVPAAPSLSSRQRCGGRAAGDVSDARELCAPRCAKKHRT